MWQSLRLAALSAGLILAANLIMAAETEPLPKLADLASTFTLRVERERFVVEKRRDVVEAAFAHPLDASAEDNWPGAFWAAEILNDRSDLTRQAFATAFASWGDRSPGFRRAALEGVHALFPGEFSKEALEVLPVAKSEREFAMAAWHAVRANSANAPAILAELSSNTKLKQSDPRLVHLRWYLERIESGHPLSPQRPPLADLLKHDFGGARPVLVSFQRPNRLYPGLATVRDKTGRFVRNADGSIYHVKQLALAMSNMPGTITNGNTPQGLHSIAGIAYTENLFMGPSPFLHSRLPMEADLLDFRHLPACEDGGFEWTEADYLALLPPSWREDFPIREAWLAGQAGRSEIVIHGSTVDPEPWRDAPFYPLTPSLGCLCTYEEWSAESGKALKSDQLPLVEAFVNAGGPRGYLLVVELDAADAPVTLADVLSAIEAAEAR